MLDYYQAVLLHLNLFKSSWKYVLLAEAKDTNQSPNKSWLFQNIVKSFSKFLELYCSSQFSFAKLLNEKGKRKRGKASEKVRAHGKRKKLFPILRLFSISVDVVLVSLLLTLGNFISSIHLGFTLNMHSCLLRFLMVFEKYFAQSHYFKQSHFWFMDLFKRHFSLGCLWKSFPCEKRKKKLTAVKKPQYFF